MHDDSHASGSAEWSRRRLLAGALAGAGGAVVLAATAPMAQAADGQSDVDDFPGPARKKNVLRDAGAGIHVGPDTAMGISTFTINPMSVTCGVGSIGNAPGAVPGSLGVPTGLGTTGPFTMLMYARTVESYVIDRKARKITARGVMRSITTAANTVLEDVDHPYVAVGVDNRNRMPDVFNLHFVTPFWTPAANPMATPSTYRDAWAMFGSTILLGEINVAP